MVEVIKADRGPRVEIHDIVRHVHGNCVYVQSDGEMLIAAKEYVYAYELGLKTVQKLLLTPEAANHTAYIPTVWIFHKGELDNYASVDIFTDAGTEQVAGLGATNGSVWLGFKATGE